MLKQSQLEAAISQLAEEFKLNFDSVLEVFAPIKDWMNEIGEKCELEGKERQSHLRLARLTSLEIELGVRDLKTFNSRRKDILSLEKICTSFESIFKEIERFDVQKWDRIFAYCQDLEHQHLLDIHCLVASQLSDLKKAQSQIRPEQRRGKQPDKRPIFVAKKIAQLFILKNLTITVGRNAADNGPSGEYCKSVKSAFELFGLKQDFLRPCQKAADWASDRKDAK